METAQKIKIKICGIFRVDDAAAINRSMPDYAGFVFVQGSHRYVAPTFAAALRAEIDERVTTVGVFRNADAAFVLSVVKDKTIGAVQLHGDEDAAYIETLRAAPDMQGVSIIQAISVSARMPQNSGAADYLLFDNGQGGTGERFDLRALLDAAKRGLLTDKPFFIAGGINESNIEAVLREIETLAPYGIDVSSGAETNGVKDAEKIERIVRRFR